MCTTNDPKMYLKKIMVVLGKKKLSLHRSILKTEPLITINNLKITDTGLLEDVINCFITFYYFPT